MNKNKLSREELTDALLREIKGDFAADGDSKEIALAAYDMFNIQSGHNRPMMTLPMGAECEMDTHNKTIRFKVER